MGEFALEFELALWVSLTVIATVLLTGLVGYAINKMNHF
jgi:hypothetical protein